MDFKKTTIITGHYGSGKTNFAVNLAVFQKEAGNNCTIADLDIVNPYFRTADFDQLFKRLGIKLCVSKYANSNLDIPSLTVSLDSALSNDEAMIIDVGGDDAGAFALGRFRQKLQNAEMLYVINKYRYLTRKPEEALQLMHDIEAASGLSCTGIVNNSNLGAETTIDIIADSIDYAKEVAELAGLPLVCTCVPKPIYEPLAVENTFPIDIYVKTKWNN